MCQLEIPVRLAGETSDYIYKVDTLRINGDTAFYEISKFEDDILTHKEEKIVFTENVFYRRISHGKTQQWYKDGSKKIEGQFEFGKKIEVWKYWAEDGNLRQDVDKEYFGRSLRGATEFFIDGEQVEIRED